MQRGAAARRPGTSDIGAIALVQDVTAETQAAHRAEALQRRLVETINHEFRTPLAALLGHVELIHHHRDRRDDLDPELAGWLDVIERSGWRLRDLVEQVAELVDSEDHDEPADRRPRSVRAGLIQLSSHAGAGSSADSGTIDRSRGAATPPGRGTDRTERLSVGISATSAQTPISPAIAAGPPSAASSPPPSSGASGRVDQLEELGGRLDPADQLGRGDGDPVGADAGVARPG